MDDTAWIGISVDEIASPKSSNEVQYGEGFEEGYGVCGVGWDCWLCPRVEIRKQ